MSVSIIRRGIVSEIVECTIGETQYSGYYYGEAEYHRQSATIIGVVVIGTTSNLPVFATLVGSRVRCYGSRASVVCTVLISYRN